MFLLPRFIALLPPCFTRPGRTTESIHALQYTFTACIAVRKMICGGTKEQSAQLQNASLHHVFVTRPCIVFVTVLWAALCFACSTIWALFHLPELRSERDTERTRRRPNTQRQRPRTVASGLSATLPAATLSPSLSGASVFPRVPRASSASTPKRAKKRLASFEPHSLDNVIESDEDSLSLTESHEDENRSRVHGPTGSDSDAPGHLTPDGDTDDSDCSEVETLADGVGVDSPASPTKLKFWKSSSRRERGRSRNQSRSSTSTESSVVSTSSTSAGSSASRPFCPHRRRAKAKREARAAAEAMQRPPLVTAHSDPTLGTMSSESIRPSLSRSSSDGSSTLVHEEATSSTSTNIESENRPRVKRQHSNSTASFFLRPFRPKSPSPLARSPVLAATVVDRDVSDTPSISGLADALTSAKEAASNQQPLTPSVARPVLDPTGQTRLVMEHVMTAA